MVARILWQFISQISQSINAVFPYSWRLLFILTVLSFTWTGIETALGKYELSALIEKFLVVGITVFLIKNLPYLSQMFLRSLIKLSGISTGMDTSVLENPSMLFDFAHTYILDPVDRVIDEQFDKANGIFQMFNVVRTSIGFLIIYGIFIVALYICFAIIVVQIVLNYILYHITLFYGVILLPFSVFKPLEFIGKNVFKAILTQALTLSVIVFVADLGLRVFRSIFTRAAMDTITASGFFDAAMLWVMLACILIYFFVCLKAPTLVMSIISGAPTLGAGGLFSTVAAIGAAAVGVGRLLSGSGGSQASSSPQGGGAQTAGAGGGGTNQFFPKVASAAASIVNTTSQAALPSGSSAPSPFLPAPSRPLLEDKSGGSVPPVANNNSDKAFSYRVVS
jgi:type IV secretion system protein TrbL